MSTLVPRQAEVTSAVVQLEDYDAPLALISRDGYFAVRGMTLNEDHVKALASRIRTVGKLDPVLLAQGKRGFVILDGAHRVAAYALAGWAERIPAKVAHCDRREALLLAARANSKLTLAMSNAERWNVAWRLVRETDRVGNATFSKRQIVEATGTSKGTVDNMRAAIAAFLRAGQKPTGNWVRDRSANAAANLPEIGDEELERMIDELAGELRKVLNVRGVSNDQALAAALQRAVGDQRLQGWFDYLYSEEADDNDGEDREPEGF